MFKRDWTAHVSNMLTILDSIANLIGGDLYDHILSNVRIFTRNVTKQDLSFNYFYAKPYVLQDIRFDHETHIL
jgi:hypothetical protein